jgi:hypothetical protein
VRGILYSQYLYNNAISTAETDNKNMTTMATGVFVTKQQSAANIIISITKIFLTIAVVAVSSSLIVASLLKGTIWLDMVST